MLFHNRGQGFVLTPGHPNQIGPGKRPMHTIIPGMAAEKGRVFMPFGIMGGQYQAMGHAHLLAKLFDHRLDLQTAIDLPRLFPLPGTNIVEMEERLRDSPRRGAGSARLRGPAAELGDRRRASDLNRLGAGNPARRVGPAQRRLRAWLLNRPRAEARLRERTADGLGHAAFH